MQKQFQRCHGVTIWFKVIYVYVSDCDVISYVIWYYLNSNYISNNKCVLIDRQKDTANSGMFDISSLQLFLIQRNGHDSFCWYALLWSFQIIFQS